MAEPYMPTPIEREHTLERGDFLKVSGDGVFATLQGEGMTAGEPAVFLRLHHCNLHCGAGGQGWPCDAWYTWDRTRPEFWQESSNVSVEAAAERIEQAWEQTFADKPTRRMVITGGEPLLQQARVIPLVARMAGWTVEIETNGTIAPRDALKVCQINCSPKLASSGNSLRARYRPQALQAIAHFPNHWFKFVIAGEEDVDEISQIVSDNGISYDRVLLMSEGTDPDKLHASDEHLAEIAQALGCLTTARNQIFWFGDKRAT